ncbi:hypothetical protein ACO0K2_07605 [Undibacterium sp. MH2W]|uniref:hypothetical protein n=1 Tax=Undibacterium sp. MH2W TaxID=3413044 RepID=UPI003BF1FB9B
MQIWTKVIALIGLSFIHHFSLADDTISHSRPSDPVRVPLKPTHLKIVLTTQDKQAIDRVAALFDKFQLYPLQSVSTTYLSPAINSNKNPKEKNRGEAKGSTTYSVKLDSDVKLDQETVKKIIDDAFEKSKTPLGYELTLQAS